MNPSTHPIHPTTSTSTRARATMDGSTIEDIRHNLAAAEHDIAGIPYTPPEAVIRWAKPLAAMARTLLNAHDNTTETTDQSRPVVGLVAHVVDLDAIEARAAAATAGPWHRDERYVVGDGIAGSRPGGEVIVQAQPTLSHWDAYSLPLRVANAEFIAHARVDVPALVAEVRRLREREAALIRAKDVDLDDVRDQLADVEAARAADANTIGVLSAAVAKVAALHVDDGDGWCKACQTLGYPCPTVLALGAGR